MPEKRGPGNPALKPMREGETSPLMRVRGPQSLIDWLQTLSAEERGRVAAYALETAQSAIKGKKACSIRDLLPSDDV